MVRARREKQQRFHLGRHGAGKNRLAQPLGELGAARLARLHHVRRFRCDEVGDEFLVGGLARALKANEDHGFHGALPSMPVSRVPTFLPALITRP